MPRLLAPFSFPLSSPTNLFTAPWHAFSLLLSLLGTGTSYVDDHSQDRDAPTAGTPPFFFSFHIPRSRCTASNISSLAFTEFFPTASRLR